MTNKEAIKWLESIDEKYIHGGDEWYDEQRHEAIKTAIKALGICDRIKVIIDSWAVDDDEHELLNQIADIIREEAENDDS